MNPILLIGVALFGAGLGVLVCRRVLAMDDTCTCLEQASPQLAAIRADIAALPLIIAGTSQVSDGACRAISEDAAADRELPIELDDRAPLAATT